MSFTTYRSSAVLLLWLDFSRVYTLPQAPEPRMVPMRYLDVSVVWVNGAWFGLVWVVIGACVGVSVSVSVSVCC